jgi:hypothetical protein
MKVVFLTRELHKLELSRIIDRINGDWIAWNFSRRSKEKSAVYFCMWALSYRGAHLDNLMQGNRYSHLPIESWGEKHPMNGRKILSYLEIQIIIRVMNQGVKNTPWTLRSENTSNRNIIMQTNEATSLPRDSIQPHEWNHADKRGNEFEPKST